VREDGRARFLARAQEYNVVPLTEELLADTLTPVGAFRTLVGDEDGFIFESVEHDERWGRFSFVGRNPLATFVARGRSVSVARGVVPGSVPLDKGALATIEALLAAYCSPVDTDLPPLHGGVVGYLGYDVVREVESLPEVPPDDLGLPDAVMAVIGELVAFDHQRGRVVLVDNAVLDGTTSPDDAYEVSRGRIARMRADLGTPVAATLSTPPERTETLDPARVRRVVSSQEYRAAVEIAKEHIRAGDAFQVVLSQRFDVELDVDPFDVYRVLRQVNPSPYMFFVRHEGVALIGASPEPLVQLLGGRVTSRPIAGTRRRGSTDREDSALAAELIEHPKERAEHLMLVDLARNDVGRVVTFGTEQVDELMTLERYSHVMHLTSQVSGVLAPGKGPVDVLRATLPAGTVSGAPKVRAMEIIDELEPTKRGPYAGVVGYLDFSGNLDVAIAIRTLVVGPDGRAFVQAGAGIVVDSDPAAEDAECVAKTEAILSAIAGARKLRDEGREPAGALR
jgi:anthranilate synthase component I